MWVRILGSQYAVKRVLGLRTGKTLGGFIGWIPDPDGRWGRSAGLGRERENVRVKRRARLAGGCGTEGDKACHVGRTVQTPEFEMGERCGGVRLVFWPGPSKTAPGAELENLQDFSLEKD